MVLIRTKLAGGVFTTPTGVKMEIEEDPIYGSRGMIEACAECAEKAQEAARAWLRENQLFYIETKLLKWQN